MCAAACWNVAIGQETITLDGAVTYQTMRGWEVTAFVASECSPAYAALRDEYIAAAVDDIGIDRIRLEVRSGVENTTDYYAAFLADGCPSPPSAEYLQWRQNRYATVNDNSDPNTINWDGFNFTELDGTVEEIVLPMKQAIEARGESLFINLNYVAFTGQIVGGDYHHDTPEEYAEFVLATYLHLQNTYGFVPDTWELVLEPDNVSQWNGTLLGEAIVATASRLSAAGFSPRFVAPSNTNMANAITYFDQMVAVPGALSFLEEFSYHRYGGVSIANLQAIADRAVQNNLSTGMLEWWFDNGTFEVLHQDLTVGRNSSWQGSTLAGLFEADTSDPVNPLIEYRPNTRFNRQYFKYVRKDAVRIDAASDGSTFDPIAFINPGGRHVVVAKASGGGNLDVVGLPPGTYGRTYTTNSAFDVHLPDVTISAGEFVSATMPESGVLTIFADPGENAVPAGSAWGLLLTALLLVIIATWLSSRSAGLRGG